MTPENGKIPDDPGPNNIRIIIDFDTTTSQIMLGGIIPGHTPFDPSLLRRH